ncbi:MAG TPA: helix-turn-helix transcriptional regulator, partial [Streptosporangiaceae bacterium]
MAAPQASHVELGDFLRSRRERLTPAELGLTDGRRRRTPGLRREEVAELAGIGVDWYVRLEPGRAVRPSAATIDALARALRLDPAERTHLRALARSPRHRPSPGRPCPGPSSAWSRAWISPPTSPAAAGTSCAGTRPRPTPSPTSAR